MDPPDEIGERFAANLERVQNLILIYEELGPTGRGRKPVPAGDLLRAAVVLLHASLEDLLRSLAEWKLPTAPALSLKRIPLAGHDRGKEKFDLADLAEFRGETVDDVIKLSIGGHLERSNYNHPGEIIDLLNRIEVNVPIEGELRADLAALMNRRHLIAHRADRNPLVGPGHQVVRSISPTLVKIWIKAVEDLGSSILNLV